jgi:hypothetical protein
VPLLSILYAAPAGKMTKIEIEYERAFERKQPISKGVDG